MKQWAIVAGVSIFAGLLGSTAAVAAVTAQDVWSAWKDMAAASGGTITTASEQTSGGTLTVTGITMTSKTEAGTITSTLNEADFAEQGDGSVAVTISPDYTVDLNMTPKDAPPVQTQVRISQSGFDLIVSGDPGDMVYDLTAPSLKIAMNGGDADGKNVGYKADAELVGLHANYTVKGTGPRKISSTSTADSLTLAMHAKSTDLGDTLDLNGKMTGLTGVMSETLLAKAVMISNPDDLNAALQAGVAIGFDLDYANADYSFDLVQDGKTLKGAAGTDSGKLTVAMDKTRLRYGVSSKNAHVTVKSAQLPVPQVELKMAESAFNMLMPVSKSDTPQDFGIMLKMAGVTVNEGLWKMIDPTGVLPRDPATLIVDLAGKAKLAFDIFDPAQQRMPHPKSGDLSSLDIKQVKLSAGGVDFSGSGAFTFDDTDTTAFMGMPTPIGSVDLKLVGGNGLMDKLVNMGLLPKDQVMSLQMMLGAFARPGAGPDTLVSKIEFTPDGHIKANGKPLQ